MLVPKPGSPLAKAPILLLLLYSDFAKSISNYTYTPSQVTTTEGAEIAGSDEAPQDFPDDILETLHPGSGHGPPGQNTNVTGCGEKQVNLLPGSAGILVSPNYPKFYDGGLDCEWNLQATEGAKIIATFMDVRVKSPGIFGTTDALFVSLDGEWGNSQRFSGDLNGFTPFNLISESDKLAIRFKTSPNSLGSNGFRMGYFVVRNGDDDGLLQPAIDGYQIGCNVSPTNLPDLVGQCREGSQGANFSDEATQLEFRKLQALNRTNPNPFLVALVLDDEYFCSGTLISNHLVLTTAYCTKGVNKIEAIMGTEDISINDDGVQRRIENFSAVLEHPYFDIDSGSHDISLIRLSEPIRFTKFVKAARLPEWRQLGQIFTGYKLNLSGWGSAKQEDGNVLTKSKTTKINITPNTGCKSSIFKGLNGMMMCSRNGFSTSNLCQADTGSPLHTRCNNYYKPPPGIVGGGSNEDDDDWDGGDDDDDTSSLGDEEDEDDGEDDGDGEYEDEDEEGQGEEEYEESDEEVEEDGEEEYEEEDEEEPDYEAEEEEEDDEESEDEDEEEPDYEAEEEEEEDEESEDEDEEEEEDDLTEDIDEILGETVDDEDDLEPENEDEDAHGEDENEEDPIDIEEDVEEEEYMEEEESEILVKLSTQNTTSLLSDSTFIPPGFFQTEHGSSKSLKNKDGTSVWHRKTIQKKSERNYKAAAISKYFQNDTDVRTKLRNTCPTCSVQNTPEDYCFLYYHFTLGKLQAKLEQDPDSADYIKMAYIARAKKPKPQKPGKPKPQRPGKPKPQKPGKPKPQRPGKPKPQRPGKPKPQRPSKPKPQRPSKPKPQRPGKPKPQRPGKPKPQRPGKPKPQKPGSAKPNRPNKPQRPTKRPERPSKPKSSTSPKPKRPAKPRPQKPGKAKPGSKPKRPGKPKNPKNRVHDAKQCLNYGYSDVVLGMVSLGSCNQGFIYTRVTAYLDFLKLNST